MRSKSTRRVLGHVAFWTVFLLVLNAYFAPPEKYFFELPYTLFLLPTYMFFVYPQVYLFVPKLLQKKKLLAYILVSVVFGKLAWWLNFCYWNHFLLPPKLGVPVEPFFYSMPWEIHFQGLIHLFPMIMVCSIFLSIKLIKQWYIERDRNQKIENEKLGMELEMLKAQVHPHFLFNTLNNLYSLTLTASANAPLVVTRLSGLLRYMLYECSEKEVPLDNEIAVLKKYVELEKLRYSDLLDISFSQTGKTGGLRIAPLLLLPFIENSFKHGISEQIGESWININLHTEGQHLFFNLSNSWNTEKSPTVSGGIGLQNIRKRMELIYPGKYELSITKEEEMHSVKLKLQLTVFEETPALSENFTINLAPATAV